MSTLLSHRLARTLAGLLGALAPLAADAAPPSYTLFESGQVRPLALSPDGSTLFVVNTPAARLEVLDIGPDGLTPRASVPVGLEPVAVAARSDSEVWVVNHVSDSVSVVDVARSRHSRVVRTLLVGDEPRDIVFAGPGRARAFITAAHRGQNNPVDPQLTTPGIGRADVWVFDAGDLGAGPGGTPKTIVTLFADTPRALAVSPDGAHVYVAAHFSGNRTTTVHRAFVQPLPEDLGGAPEPFTDHSGVPRPWTGLIVQHDGEHWVDETGRAWDDSVRFDLPDRDVFTLDALAPVPVEVPGPGAFTGVGTTLYDMVVNPASGKVYVSNTEARNHLRFEGPGEFAGASLRGRTVENRVTVLAPVTRDVLPRHLNPHIDPGQCCAALPNEENELSLALPRGMAVTADGHTLYVAATGSDKIGVYDTAQLEADDFWPDPDQQLVVGGGGPTGLALDEARGRLYVMTRFDDSVAVIDLDTGDEIQHLALHNPEPPAVVAGRRFLYDARHTSSHGDTACASCHVDGDMDHLAWDLGDPDADPRLIPGPFKFVNVPEATFHPMKGPMTTQSLRGLANHGPMHWRGDRNGGYAAPLLGNAQPDAGAFDERAAFRQFNAAFVALLGRDEELPPAEMEAFTDFALRLTYPPNPIRSLDNALTADQQMGSLIFHTLPTDTGALQCVFCHVHDRDGNAQHGVDAPGFFGTDGSLVMGELVQTLKIPQLRNMYQKVGKFGFPADPVINPHGDTGHLGDQVRGFGFIHDGSLDTVARFISALGFSVDLYGPDARRQVESFVLAFDSNLFPVVGQQITLRPGNLPTAGPRATLLRQRADQGECDLVVHGVLSGRAQGFLYQGGLYKRDRAADLPLLDASLRSASQVATQEMTFTCAPPGSGRRLAVDRDLDGQLDGDEPTPG